MIASSDQRLEYADVQRHGGQVMVTRRYAVAVRDNMHEFLWYARGLALETDGTLVAATGITAHAAKQSYFGHLDGAGIVRRECRDGVHVTWHIYPPPPGLPWQFDAAYISMSYCLADGSSVLVYDYGSRPLPPYLAPLTHLHIQIQFRPTITIYTAPGRPGAVLCFPVNNNPGTMLLAPDGHHLAVVMGLNSKICFYSW